MPRDDQKSLGFSQDQYEEIKAFAEELKTERGSAYMAPAIVEAIRLARLYRKQVLGIGK